MCPRGLRLQSCTYKPDRVPGIVYSVIHGPIRLCLFNKDTIEPTWVTLHGELHTLAQP